MNINNGNEQIFIKGREIASKKYVDDNKYTLPLASNEVLGGIKVGENLEITEDGTLNAKGGVNSYIWDGSTGESAKALFQKWLDEFLETGIANNIVYGTDSSYSQYGLIEWTYEHNNSGHQLRFTFGNHNYGDIREQLNYKTLKCELDHGTNKIIENIYLDSNYTNVLPIYRYSKHMGYQKYMALSTNNDSEYTPTGDYNPATKKYVDDSITSAIAGVSQFSLLPVDTLPTENIKTNVIYAVPSDNPKEQDVRIEYVYINNAWEILGTTKIDLSNYYTKAEIDAMFASIANYTPVASAEEAANILNGTTTEVVEGGADISE